MEIKERAGARWRTYVLQALGAVFLAAIIMALQTPPDTAISNAALWTQRISGWAPAWLRPESADTWATVILSMALGAVLLSLWQRYRRAKRPSDGTGTDDQIKMDAMNVHLGQTMEMIAQALGSEEGIAYEMAVAQSETFLMGLGKWNDVAIPELRANGVETGTLRAFSYLNFIMAPLRLGNVEEIRIRAAEIVPRLNAKSAEELRADLALPRIGPPRPAKTSASGLDSSVAAEIANWATAPTPRPRVLADLQRAPCRLALEKVQELLDKKIVGLVSDLLPTATRREPEFSEMLARVANLATKAQALHSQAKSLSRDHAGSFTLLGIDLSPLNEALKQLTPPLIGLVRAKDYPEVARNEAVEPVARANNQVAYAARDLAEALAHKRKEHFHV